MSQLQVTGEAKVRDIQGPVVANSGVITALDGAASQYVRGDGTLADFPTSSGGGSSVSYYLNSSVSQGTIGGVAYRELSKEPIIGAGTDIAISANGYVASYLTDANDPDVLSIPGGNFNCEFYFSVNNNTGNPFFYAELYKYDGTTFTLLGSSVGVPEYINQGTIIAPYYFAIPVPTSALALTDRLAIRIYVNVDGRTVTLHTENGHLCQVVTTLSKGMVSLNNLTDQSQYLTTGTSGTDFNIVSSGDTHTFNLPVASATNTGKLSSTDWSTFNNKQAALSFTAPLDNTSNTISIPAASDSVDGYLDNLDWTKFNTAYNDSIISAAVTGTTTKTLTLNQQDGGTITASWTDDNTDAVTSVFGRTGAVLAVSGDYNTSQVTENTNLYFTDARARAAISLTTTGTSGAATYNSTTGVFNIPNYTTDLSGYVTLATAQTISGAKTFSNPLVGTSATFSSSLTANRYIINGTNGNSGQIIQQGDLLGSVATNLLIQSSTSNGIGFLTNGGTTFNMFINTSGNVGIGTSTPSNTLDVVKAASHAIRVQNTADATDAYFIAQNTGGSAFFGLNATGPYIYTVSALAMQFITTNVERMRITSGGNVGIGTSSPTPLTATALVTQINSSNTFSELRLTNSSTSNGAILAQYGLDSYLSNLANGFMVFGTNNTERMRITSGGNILIGTTTDNGSRLQVNGAVNVTNGRIILNGTASDGRAIMILGDATYPSGSIVAPNTGGTILIAGQSGTGMTIGTTGAATFSSNVGIGTSSPSVAKFVIEGSGTTESRVINTATTGQAAMWVRNNVTSEAGVGIYGTSSTAYGSIGSGESFFYSTTPLSIVSDSVSGIIKFSTAGAAERMRITSGGNVFIGTTTGVSGGGALQVNGNVNINGVFQINGTTIGGGGGSGVTGSGTTNNLTKWTGASTIGNSILTDNGSRLIQNAGDGFVIATNTSDTIGGGSFLALTNAAQTRWVLQQINASFGLDWWTYNGTSWSTRMTLTAGGNFLLGSTTDNGSRLQVAGSGSFSNNLGIGTSSPDTYGSRSSLSVNGVNGGIITLQVGGTKVTEMYAASGGLTQFTTTGSFGFSGGPATFISSVTATSFFESSDSRLKIVVKDYKQPKGIENVPARMYVKNSRQELGYFAQDLQEVLPSAVIEGEDGFLNLSYSQVHTAKIAYLENKIAQLEELIKTLL
jgi:hypothetical protein